jgi:transposase
MYYGVQSHLPVYYNVYSGSISDKSHLPCMLYGTKKLGIHNPRFVLDRGFVTEENMKYMNEENSRFISAFPQHFVETKRLIDECKDVIHKSENRVKPYGVYAVPITTEVYGFNMRAHVYFDPKKLALDEDGLYSHIDRLEEDLEKMKKTKRVTKRYTEFFTVEQENKDNISFEPDNERINERLSRAGFFVLLTNDTSVDSGEVLKIYRMRDVIEKNFNQLKNEIDFKRLRTHVNKTMDGKVFVGFIALIIRSYLLTKIKRKEETKKLTLEKILIELRKIKVVTFEDATRRLIPVTKTQRMIIEALDFSTEELLRSVD